MKRGNILIIALISVVAILSLSAAGYLFIQNRQLQNQTVKLVSPTQFSAPAPAPTPAPVPTINPTANWKTYTNKELGYSIQHPSDWTEQYNKNRNLLVLTGNEGSVSILWSERATDSVIACFESGTQQDIYSKAGVLHACRYFRDNGSETWNIIKQKFDDLRNNAVGFIIQGTYKNPPKNSVVISQILSTFKFL